MSNFFNHANFWYIEFSIQSFEKYVNLVEDKFNVEILELQGKFNEIQSEKEENKDNYDPDYQSFLTDSTIEEMIEIDVEFVQRFRNSVIIQIFSFLEVELKKFCYYHAKANNKEYSIDDLKGNTDLEKAKKYLKKSANIDITIDSTNWRFIDNIRKLRNKIVHHNSIVETTDRDYNSLLNFSNGNFELKRMGLQGSEIVLNDVKFIRKCLVQVQNFLKINAT